MLQRKVERPESERGVGGAATSSVATIGHANWQLKTETETVRNAKSEND